MGEDVQKDLKNELIANLRSADFLIRCDSVEKLSQFPEAEVLNVLIDMLNDKNYLVRCEVYEALSNFKSENILSILVNRIKRERSSTVRMYAISTICHLVKQISCNDNLIEELESLYDKEKSKRVIISYLSLMYLIEKNKKYIIKALEYINDIDYHIRCNVINLLSEVIDREVIELVCIEYNRRYLVENAQSVKILLEHEINELCNYQRNPDSHTNLHQDNN